MPAVELDLGRRVLLERLTEFLFSWEINSFFNNKCFIALFLLLFWSVLLDRFSASHLSVRKLLLFSFFSNVERTERGHHSSPCTSYHLYYVLLPVWK